MRAVFDPSPESVADFQPLLAEGGVACETEAELCARGDVDWVLVGSPNHAHRAQAICALQAGKDVFCEKPLATTVADALAIREAVHASGRRFVFGLVLRHSPFYQKVRELLDGGAIGQVVSFEFNETLPFDHGGYIMGNWRRWESLSGGHLLEKCCHDIDIANWLCGSLPVRAASFGGRDVFKPANRALADQSGTLADGRNAYQSWYDRARVDPFGEDKDIADNQVAIIEYANGARATFHTNCHSALPERRFYLNGTHGALRGNLLTGEIEARGIGRHEVTTSTRFPHAGGHGDGDGRQVANLCAVMRREAEPLAGIEEGVRSTLAAIGIEEARRRSEVYDLRPLWEHAGVMP